jgi:dTDP-4-dehydrorhamnose 3,5-epimerase-like enzyme
MDSNDVIAERLKIIVTLENGKSISFPGEWASNFVVDKNGSLVRKNYQNKFYMDPIKNINWNENSLNNLSSDEIAECLSKIDKFAKDKGWDVVIS